MPAKAEFSLEQGILSITANLGTVGLDSLQYEVCNDCNTCDSTWFYLEIANLQPKINDADFNISYQQQLQIDLGDYISDENQNLDTSSLSVIQGLPSGATISFTDDFSLLLDYSETNFSGEESFVIGICDHMNQCTEGTFNINVEGSPELIIYNAISPNNDGNNDFLEITTIERYPENKLTILNRWGDKVFKVANYNNTDRRFEGRSNLKSSSRLPSGTYFYELILINPNQKYTGYLLLKY